MNSKWQDNLRNRMEQHQVSPPNGLWDDIEKALKAENASAQKNTPKTHMLWYRRVGVAAAAAIFFFITLNVIIQNQRTMPTTTSSKHQQSVAVATPQAKNILVPKVQTTQLAHNSTNKKHLSSNTSYKRPETGERPLIEEGAKIEEVENLSDVTQEITAQSEEKENLPKENQRLYSHSNNIQGRDIKNSDDATIFFPAKRQLANISKWQTDFYASNIPSNSAKDYAGGYCSFSQPNLGFFNDYSSVAGSNLPQDILRLNEYQLVYSEIKHYQPITIGVSLKYSFAKRWNVTSGLSYTTLISKLRSGSQENYYNSKQTLHYIGIPVNLNYIVWENRRISTYLSGGGMVEKNVSGTLSTDYMINNKIEEHSTSSISVKPLQWSVNSAVGIQYQLSRIIGIYAEPGVTCFLKNKSDIETIYKDKPLNFTLKLGLRFSLDK